MLAAIHRRFAPIAAGPGARRRFSKADPLPGEALSTVWVEICRFRFGERLFQM
jgi:hypothetical protein